MQNTGRRKELGRVHYSPKLVLRRCKSFTDILFLQIPSIIVAG